MSGKRAVMMLGLLGLLGCAGERPRDLGVHDGRLAACPSSPNCVSSRAEDERHRITPLAVTGAPAGALALLRGVLAARADCIVIEEGEGYLRVELRTRLFVDDAEFLLDAAAGVIHVRSASRLGYWDLGMNRRRMEEIRREYAAAGGNR